MKFFRKTSPQSLGRRRLTREPEATPQIGNAFSYRARRSEAEAPTGRHEQRPSQRPGPSGWRFWLRRTGLALLLVAVVAGLTNVISLAPSAAIMPLTTNHQSSPFLQQETVYQAYANKLLGSSIWNRNKITINTGQITAKMLQQFPELASVSITLPVLAHRPLVYIQPAQPVLILNASNGSFVVDSRGKALLLTSQVPSLSQLNLVPLTDQSGLKVAPHGPALTAQNVTFIQTVLAQLAARSTTVSSMTLPATASELDVQPSGKPYFIKFNLQSTDARQQAGTYLATIAQLQKQGITPTQYVDVRVDGRAYYK
jgi:cell division septal protein FtsQ